MGAVATLTAPSVAREAGAPSTWRDYLALTKPGITGLIVLVAVAGYFLALPPTVDLAALGLLVMTGAIASAGASMLNHYLDRDVDALMRRTRGRPLAQARITPGAAVAVAGVMLSVVGIGLAVVLINPLTGFAIALGSVTYVGLYTYVLKRRTSWNIVIGGFAGSAPALAGSAAAVGTFTPGVLAFALLVFLWTPPHFWSLAILLRDDYRRAGLPMVPRPEDPTFVGRAVVLGAGLLVAATVVLVLLGPVTLPVAVVLLALAVAFVALTWPLLKSVERPVARRGFIFSGIYLLGVIVALVVNWGLVAALGIAPLVR